MNEKTEKPARQAGWEVAFVDAVARHQEAPFAWGVSDCLTAIADLDVAMTGHDPMHELRGTYKTHRDALAVLKKAGFGSIEEALAANYDSIAPAEARRGDCGVVENSAGGKPELAAVIVLGAMVMGKAEPDAGTKGVAASGAVFLPRERLVKAYRIG